VLGLAHVRLPGLGVEPSARARLLDEMVPRKGLGSPAPETLISLEFLVRPVTPCVPVLCAENNP
jgi:hypothetical protein